MRLPEIYRQGGWQIVHAKSGLGLGRYNNFLSRSVMRHQQSSKQRIIYNERVRL